MESAKDRNGMTEAQFLRSYDVTEYFRPSVTVDAVLYTTEPNGLKLLMVRRGGHPFIGQWAFPGGFVEKDESCEAAAPRELFEETGIAGVPLRQFITASTPGRDPRWRNITVVFCARLQKTIKAVGGDDAADAEWFDVKCDINKDGAVLGFSSEAGESFTVKLNIVRDEFGQIDINRTEIVERGKVAFDHAKIVCALYECAKEAKS